MAAAPETALDAAQLAHWREHGYVPPLQAIPPAAAAALAQRFVAEFDGGPAMNRHCDLPSVATLCREADVWGRIAGLLGPDLLLWRTNLFLGNPALEWHEDQHARLLGGGFGLSALLALTDGSADNCTLVAPGSHRLDPQAKARRYGLVADPRPGGNVRYKGTVRDTDFVRVPLRAGQCLIFHPELLHASSGSLGGGERAPRMNLVLRVTPGDTRVDEAAYAAGGDGAPADPRVGPVPMRGTRHAEQRFGRLA